MTPLPNDLSEEEKRGFDPRGKAYGVIYRATNKINGKRYIGQTINSLEVRRYSHLWCARHRKSYFGAAINRNGEENFDWEVIDHAYSRKELDQLEVYWVRFYRANDRAHGYNLEEGGNGKGAVAESTKLKASKAHKARYANGYIHPMTGKTLPQEQIDRMSETKKRQYHSGEKIIHNVGQPMNVEQKEKLRQIKIAKGSSKPPRPPSPNQGKHFSIATEFKPGEHPSSATEFPSVRIQCVETGVIYETLKQAARELGISHANFSMYLKGKRKSVAGCQWIKLTN